MEKLNEHSWLHLREILILCSLITSGLQSQNSGVPNLVHKNNHRIYAIVYKKESDCFQF